MKKLESIIREEYTKLTSEKNQVDNSKWQWKPSPRVLEGLKEWQEIANENVVLESEKRLLLEQTTSTPNKSKGSSYSWEYNVDYNKDAIGHGRQYGHAPKHFDKEDATKENEDGVSALDYFGHLWQDTPDEIEAFKWLWKTGAIPSQILDELYWMKIGEESGDMLSFQTDDEVYSYQYLTTYDYRVKKGRLQSPIDIVQPEESLEDLSDEEKKNIEPLAKLEEASYGFVKIPDLVPPPLPEVEEKSWKDTVQTILDWFGLIPGYGDIIDVINAVWYLIRGKPWDALFSSIAVIPFVGSVLSLGLKSGFKGMVKIIGPLLNMMTKSGKLANSARKADKLAYKTMRAGFLKGGVKPKELKIFAEWGPWIGKKLHGAANLLPRIPFVGTSKAGKKFATYMKKQANMLENVAQISKDTIRIAKASKKAAKLARETDEVMSLGKMVKQSAKKLKASAAQQMDNKMFRMFGFEIKQYGEQIARALDKRFIRRMAKDVPDPHMINQASKYGFNWTDEVAQSISKNSKKMSREFFNKYGRYKPEGLLNLFKKDPKAATEMIKEMYRTGGDVAKDAVRINKGLGEVLVKNNDDVVKIFRENMASDPSKIRTMLSWPDNRGADRARKKILRNYALWWNEVEEILEDVGLDDVDEPNGVIWPFFLRWVLKYTPGLGWVGKKVRGGIYSGVEAMKKAGWWGQESALADLKQLVPGLAERRILWKRNWTQMYPDMSDSEKVRRLLKLNPGKEKEVIDNLNDSNSDMADLFDGDLMDTQKGSKEKIDDIYKKHMKDEKKRPERYYGGAPALGIGSDQVATVGVKQKKKSKEKDDWWDYTKTTI